MSYECCAYHDGGGFKGMPCGGVVHGGMREKLPELSELYPAGRDAELASCEWCKQQLPARPPLHPAMLCGCCQGRAIAIRRALEIYDVQPEESEGMSNASALIEAVVAGKWTGQSHPWWWQLGEESETERHREASRDAGAAFLLGSVSALGERVDRLENARDYHNKRVTTLEAAVTELAGDTPQKGGRLEKT